MRNSFVVIFVTCCVRASQSAALQCEVCQLLSVLMQEALEDLGPKSRSDISEAAGRVVAAVGGKNNPCKNGAIWDETAKKTGTDIAKVQTMCRREFERLEEVFEASLGDPTLRDEKLRQKICGEVARKPACQSLWPESEVPVSKNRAARLRNEAAKREAKEGAENDKKAKAFFKANKGRPGVESFPSGLQMKVLQEGQGAGPPTVDQKVTLHYRGLLIDCIPQTGPAPCKGGTEFDSTFSCKEGTPSAERQACEKNKPISFTANQAGTFWLEILPRMREGSHVEVCVPYSLAYGSAENPSKRPSLVGPKAALIFQVELLNIIEQASFKDHSTIPGSGTTYKIVSPGMEDSLTVQVGDKVTVHATGSVLATEKKFWSTKDAGQKPFTYTVGGEVIRGWDIGGQGMRKGEIRQIRIPSEEGYGATGFPAWGIPPSADLLFELEVLEIKRKSQEL